MQKANNRGNISIVKVYVGNNYNSYIDDSEIIENEIIW